MGFVWFWIFVKLIVYLFYSLLRFILWGEKVIMCCLESKVKLFVRFFLLRDINNVLYDSCGIVGLDICIWKGDCNVGWWVVGYKVNVGVILRDIEIR